MLIDTHSHIFEPEFDEDRDEVVQRAKDAGISRVYLPNIDVDSIEILRQTTQAYADYCFPMMGLHPTSVKEDYKEALARIEQALMTHQDYVAIGEIGLDLYWDKTYYKEQVDAFVTQLDWALRLDMPVAIHCREAFPEILEVLKQEKYHLLKGVMHSFGGTEKDANAILSLPNLKFGINGVVTFKKSQLPEVLRSVPIDRIVLETDAPYLAPTPYRGKRNEPAYVVKVAEKLSEIYMLSMDEIKAITTQNALDLFSKKA